MKRWVAAAVAVLFLATATLHVLAHHGDDGGCAVCQVQQGSLPGQAPPIVAAAAVPEIALAEAPAPSLLSARPVSAAARAPPFLLA